MLKVHTKSVTNRWAGFYDGEAPVDDAPEALLADVLSRYGEGYAVFDG